MKLLQLLTLACVIAGGTDLFAAASQSSHSAATPDTARYGDEDYSAMCPRRSPGEKVTNFIELHEYSIWESLKYVFCGTRASRTHVMQRDGTYWLSSE